ncbi:YcjF family protein [Marinibacterium profundimaris]|uniref:GTP-binding protein n=1 Tax=Marinibacterium profundimaris TaxID=1679460 RepID=A0A225NHA6_9RHOB|nr:TIGR01620 family protein [Marinibacterium profundimaris]OWU72976.1 GTP-binding protein [Marinibacterium profundimaris]
MSKGPVLFDLDDDRSPGPDPAPSVADAPPVPDLTEPLPGAGRSAMETAVRAAGRPTSRLARWFWGLAAAILGFVISVAAWQFAASLVASVPILGWIATALLVAFVLVALVMGIREMAAFGRLTRVDHIKRDADAALADADLEAARAVIRQLDSLYKGREDTRWGRERLAERVGDQFDAVAVFALAEDTLLAPLDVAAAREVEAAARQVATVTALVPLALADVATAFASSLRMIRRVAEIYGGRSGFFGGWRLTRAVFSHLVATGAVAAGEDLLEPVLGGSVLSKLSRRFGEGLVNGALSARVGVAAMEVCRPLPFSPRHKPSVRRIIKNALSGLLGRRS